MYHLILILYLTFAFKYVFGVHIWIARKLFIRPNRLFSNNVCQNNNNISEIISM